MPRVLVTGASGFIGAALSGALGARPVRTAGRAARGGDHVIIPDLTGAVNWRGALEGVEAVIHLAGPAHARFTEASLETEIARATAALAAQAAEAGVRRFIFVSSIKAAAPRSYDAPLGERDPPAPEDAYGRAKLHAERAVLAHDRLNPIVLRPPLVHAPDARANFAALLRLAASGAPLPFKGIANRRSLIARDSLIAAIKAALDGQARGVFHLADQPALSTGEIIAALRAGLGQPARLFRAPWLAALAPAALSDSLEADDSAFRAAFGAYGGDSAAALKACAAAWKARR